MITIVHPSRERAEIAKKIYDEWLFKADAHFEYYLSIEPDQEDAYLQYFDKKDIIVNDNLTAIEAINNACKKIDFETLIVISDDFHCREKWDIQINQATNRLENYLLKTFDGMQSWLVTLPIMDRAFYESYGYVYNPQYRHMFADTEMTAVAEMTGRLHFRNDIVFTHKQLNDELNVRNNKTWTHGEAIYLENYKKNFGIDNPVKQISDLAHKRWLKQHLK